MNDKPWLTEEYRAYLKSPEWVLDEFHRFLDSVEP